jgi:hypothetical protein
MSEAPRLIAGVVLFVVAAGGLEVFEALVLILFLVEAVAGEQGLVDGPAQAILVHQDRFHRHIGGELDVVQRAGIGRVRHRHVQSVAALKQGQGLVLLD